MNQRIAIANLRVADTDERFVYVEGVANDASVTDSYRTRFRFTEDCMRESEGIKLLFNHNPDFIVGAVERLWKDGNNLMFRGKVRRSAKTPGGDSIGELVEDGLLNEASIHFDRDAKYEYGKEYDTITPNYLHEISLTPIPSNRGSKFNKRFLDTLRQLEAENPEAHTLARALRLGMEALGEEEAEHRTLFFLRDSGPLSHSNLENRLWMLMEQRAGGEYYSYSITAIYDDYLVYCDYRMGKFYKCSYAVDENGNVTLGDDDTEVLMTFVEVNNEMSEERTEVEAERTAPEQEAPAWATELRQALDELRAEIAALRGEEAEDAGKAPEAEVETERAEGKEEPAEPERTADDLSLDEARVIFQETFKQVFAVE